MKIVFICKDRNAGYYDGKYGLWNSASFVSQTINKIKDVQSEVISVVDGNSLDREITQRKPDMVILEAIWVTPEKLAEVQKLHPKVKFVCRVHSKATFLANEGIAFEWMNAYEMIPNVEIAVNNFEFFLDLRHIGYKVTFLPNIYATEWKSAKYQAPKESINIGCFGSLRPMKNHLHQAIAAIRFANSIGKKLRFHINSSRAEQNGGNVLKNLRALFGKFPAHTLIEHQWLSHKDFLSLISYMDIGMQVSLSESFNIVTADFVSQNVPVVTSKEIKFVNWAFKASPTDTNEIINALYNAYYGSRIGLHRINSLLLSYDIADATDDWVVFLGRLRNEIA